MAANGNGNGMTGRFFDLDAARIARLEMKGEAPTIRWGGEVFTLPVEMPIELAYVLEDDPKEAVRMLLGDQFDRFWSHPLSHDDLDQFLRALKELYGVGGSSASGGGSSTTNGTPSRPTSRRTTSSTSAKSASGRRR